MDCVTFRRMRTVSKQCSRQSWHKRQECLILARKGPVRTCKNLMDNIKSPILYVFTHNMIDLVSTFYSIGLRNKVILAS